MIMEEASSTIISSTQPKTPYRAIIHKSNSTVAPSMQLFQNIDSLASDDTTQASNNTSPNSSHTVPSVTTGRKSSSKVMPALNDPTEFDGFYRNPNSNNSVLPIYEDEDSLSRVPIPRQKSTQILTLPFSSDVLLDGDTHSQYGDSIVPAELASKKMKRQAVLEATQARYQDAVGATAYAEEPILINQGLPISAIWEGSERRINPLQKQSSLSSFESEAVHMAKEGSYAGSGNDGADGGVGERRRSGSFRGGVALDVVPAAAMLGGAASSRQKSAKGIALTSESGVEDSSVVPARRRQGSFKGDEGVLGLSAHQRQGSFRGGSFVSYELSGYTPKSRPSITQAIALQSAILAAGAYTPTSTTVTTTGGLSMTIPAQSMESSLNASENTSPKNPSFYQSVDVTGESEGTLRFTSQLFPQLPVPASTMRNIPGTRQSYPVSASTGGYYNNNGNISYNNGGSRNYSNTNSRAASPKGNVVFDSGIFAPFDLRKRVESLNQVTETVLKEAASPTRKDITSTSTSTHGETSPNAKTGVLITDRYTDMFGGGVGAAAGGMLGFVEVDALSLSSHSDRGSEQLNRSSHGVDHFERSMHGLEYHGRDALDEKAHGDNFGTTQTPGAETPRTPQKIVQHAVEMSGYTPRKRQSVTAAMEVVLDRNRSQQQQRQQGEGSDKAVNPEERGDKNSSMRQPEKPIPWEKRRSTPNFDNSRQVDSSGPGSTGGVGVPSNLARSKHHRSSESHLFASKQLESSKATEVRKTSLGLVGKMISGIFTGT